MTDYEWETIMDYSPEEQMMDTYVEWEKMYEARQASNDYNG